MMKVSFGIITYHDNNLDNLLLSILKQKLKKTIISEIIVISAQNEDSYINKIIKEYSSVLKIKNYVQKKRKGKYNAINLFLKSGDVVQPG